MHVGQFLSRLLTDEQTMDVLRFSNNPIVSFLRETRLYTLMGHGFRKLGLTKAPLPPEKRGKESGRRIRVPIDEAVENYKIMAGMADRTIIILPPFSSESFRGMESYKQIIAASLKGYANIVRFPKMELTSPNSKEYFSDDGFHPNEPGASLMANHLKDLILQNK